MRTQKMKKYKILTLEAREAFEIDVNGRDFHIYNEDGSIRYRRFNSFLHNSLELEHIRNAFENAKRSRRLKGKFVVDTQHSGGEDYDATLAVVNVVFNSDDRIFSKKKGKNGYVYVLKGEKIDFTTDICDHVCIRDDKLIAIEVPYETKKAGYLVSDDKYAPVVCPCDRDYLDGYFKYDEESLCYVKTSKKLPSIKTRNELRKHIYENGFTVNGKFPVKYVRYKRSAGSSRQGNCLFIMEPLYKEMMKWSACGLDLDAVKDQISKESYISLTLSNMEKEIIIPKESILFLPDAVSTFESFVVAVGKDENGKVVSEPKTVTVENSIWDGQGLLDACVFEENGYGHKGMMLLRNRFFKTCAFNTNLQAWFKDRGITSVSQLNPKAYTEAKSIEDIKLVITDSSLKYIKLCGKGRVESIKQWLQNVDPVFGLVKTEKPTKHMNGKMVQTSYQLINTLSLDQGEIKELVRPSLEYLFNIQNDPTFMRHYIKMNLSDDNLKGEEYSEDEGESVSAGSMRGDVVLKLLSLNDKFAQTHEYANFRSQIKKSYVKELKHGHLLVDGTNATLFGNGYEMLCAITDPQYDFDAPKELGLCGNQIRISRFENGKELLCARSPHITMGNLLVAENNYSLDDGYAKYFNLSREIICVNSIGQNLLQRLNGCDFDSDMMLVTDNEIMLGAAKRYYDSFPVPFCNGSAVPKSQALWEIDRDISDNKIGKIVNLSQWLNSVYWDKHQRGEDVEELYREICKLAVLSGMEIDKAKRDYGIDAQRVLDEVKAACLEKGDKRPEFFVHAKNKSSKRPKVSKDNYTEEIYTSMQLLDNEVSSSIKRSKRGLGASLTSLLPATDKCPEDNDYRYRRQIVLEMSLKQIDLSCKRGLMFRLYDDEREIKMQECHDIEYYCVNYVKRKMKNESVLRLLVKSLDGAFNDAQSCRSLLLSAICNANDNLYRLIADTRDEMEELEEDENGEYEIHGYRFRKAVTKR